MKRIKIIITSIIIICSILLINNTVRAEETSEVYESLLTTNSIEDTSKGNVTYAQYVTKEMSKTSYWKNRAKSANKVLMTINEIKDLNQSIIDTSGTQVVDLENITNPLKVSNVESYEKNNALRQLYINGSPIDQQEYLTKYEQALKTSKYPDGTERGIKVFYAVAVKRADMKVWPIDEYVGYSETDPDDETENHAINVNEPVVIRDVCVVDGKTFYLCQSNVCSGWINAENLAIFESKEQWLDSWKIDISKKDFLVVLQDKITLEPSVSVPATSDIKLMLGTTVKLVPEKEIPQNIGERGTWNNYVVYLPTRDENGKYVKQYALISEHYNVSTGFIPMTQSNILDVAFTCLGNRYGWGGMLGAMDCSAYTRAIYQCFGLQLPRNTTWQQLVPGKLTDISSYTDEQKQAYLETIPAGSLLYFPGHTMVYIGSDSGRGYVISATGSLSDSDGDLKVQSMYSVIINPLTTRRGNGRTWLNNLTSVLTIVPPEYIKEHIHEYVTNTIKATLSKNGSIVTKCSCGEVKSNIVIPYPKNIKLKTTSYTYNGKEKKPAVIITDANGKTISTNNYTVQYTNNKNVGTATATIIFKGNYTGTKKINYTINPIATTLSSLTSGKKKLTTKWKKQTIQTTGYQIQYSTDKNFKKGNKTTKITKNKTTSKTITKLTGKKKYYVRIRTYKTIKGKTYYSSWSKSKNTKTK